MINTEKPSGKAEQKKQSTAKTSKVEKQEVKKMPKNPEEKESSSKLGQAKEKNKPLEKVSEGGEAKKPETEKPKKQVQKKPVVKKTEAVVNAYGIPISTKDSVFICKFINHKSLEKAMTDLEEVAGLKKAVPMKGEIPHRKGKRMSSGRFPQKAVKNFINLIKTLIGNANANNIDSPIIVEAMANLGSRPYGKFGSVRRKRTHIFIKAMENKPLKKVSKTDKKAKKIKKKKARPSVTKKKEAKK